MSHSQFHSTNLFILRHAWLNLWDKHMTTGRINQVTVHTKTHRPVKVERATTSRRKSVFHGWSSSHDCWFVRIPMSLRSFAPLRARYYVQTSVDRLALYPTLTNFDHRPPVQRQRWMFNMKTTLSGTQAVKPAHTQAFLQMIKCTTLAIGK
jgi:hypothetical protein